VRVEIAAEAEADLDAIAEYIARDSANQALDFVRQLRETCERIALFPKRFPLVRKEDRSEIRKALHGNYLIFFQIEDEIVYMIHVLHAATDYETRLFDQ
jgi:plasmid stabilization system protein ParE